MECINYNFLDFCNYLLVTANFHFENNRVLLSEFLLKPLCKLKTKAISSLLQSINGKKTIYLILRLRWKFSAIELGGRSLSRRLKKSGLGRRLRYSVIHWTGLFKTLIFCFSSWRNWQVWNKHNYFPSAYRTDEMSYGIKIWLFWKVVICRWTGLMSYRHYDVKSEGQVWRVFLRIKSHQNDFKKCRRNKKFALRVWVGNGASKTFLFLLYTLQMILLGLT